VYRALLSSAVDRIPAARLDELRQTVGRFYGVEQLDSALLQRAAAIDTKYVVLRLLAGFDIGLGSKLIFSVFVAKGRTYVR